MKKKSDGERRGRERGSRLKVAGSRMERCNVCNEADAAQLLPDRCEESCTLRPLCTVCLDEFLERFPRLMHQIRHREVSGGFPPRVRRMKTSNFGGYFDVGESDLTSSVPSSTGNHDARRRSHPRSHLHMQGGRRMLRDVRTALDRAHRLRMQPCAPRRMCA